MSNPRYKFWVWDKTERLMKQWNDIVDHHTMYIFCEDRFVPMQYTGLHDKKRTEIFEGDVVELEAIADYGDEAGDINFLYTGEVVILPSKGVCLKNPICIDRLEDNKTWKCNYYKNIASYRSEVIGNIYGVEQ